MSSIAPQQPGVLNRKPRISLQAAGSMYLTPPAHKIGLVGGAYRYGRTAVGGIRNMLHNGQALYSNVDYASVGGSPGWFLGGGTFYNPLAKAFHGQVVTFVLTGLGPVFVADANGEFIGATGGKYFEAFTTAGTVSQVINGSTAVTFTGASLNTNTLPGYAYTPNKNLIQAGDILDVTITGTHYFYRITGVGGANSLTIFPAWQQASAGPGAGYAYAVRRSGYGSRSRVAQIINTTTGVIYGYYAGNTIGKGVFSQAGTIQCVNTSGAHFMAPQAGAVDIKANDVALYRSFMLYGAGGAVGWSVAGFPTSFATGFGATDFPAGNIAVLETDDEFVTFEYWGDQLVAIFEHGMWLYGAAGAVPEFDFQKLPEIAGPSLYYGPADEQLGGFQGIVSTTRPTCSGRGCFYYFGQTGLMQVQGYLGQAVSQPVEPMNWTGSANATGQVFDLSYDPDFDIVYVSEHYTTIAMAYQAPLKSWSVVDFLGTGIAFPRIFAAGSDATRGGPATTAAARAMSLAWYDNVADKLRISSYSGLFVDPSITWGNADRTWTWPSAVVFLSDVQGDFDFGGVLIRARAALGAGVTNLTVQVYGGSSPYKLYARGSPITVDYQDGSPSSRQILGQVLSDAYMGFVLSGSSWIELEGIDIYASDTPARR